jgi:hypothetical protein
MLSGVKKYIQPIAWLTALVLLFFLEKDTASNSLCIFKLAGIDKCPGCGIGHAIREALHFNIARSFQTHVLGIPAAIILICYITRIILTSVKLTYHGSENAYDVTRPSA